MESINDVLEPDHSHLDSPTAASASLFGHKNYDARHLDGRGRIKRRVGYNLCHGICDSVGRKGLLHVLLALLAISERLFDEIAKSLL